MPPTNQPVSRGIFLEGFEMTYKKLTLEEALWLIHQIRIFCQCRKLEIDTTAKEILLMINKELENV